MLLAGTASGNCDKCLAQSSGGAKMYYSWLKSCLRDIRNDVPSITASAESAARRFVKDGYEIGAWGDPAFVSEFGGRAGGIMPVCGVSPDTAAKTVILMTLREDHLADDLRQAAEFEQRGNTVVIFARKALAKSAKPGFIETHAAPHGGLISSDGKWSVPTDPTAAIAALWTWTGEFIAACTRLGSAPAVWQSIMAPGSRDRNARFAGVRFLEKCPPPVPPGKIARDYLNAVEKNLDEVYAKDAVTISKAASMASKARAAGGNLYAGFMGHALQVQMGCAHDTGLFKPTAGADIKPGDFVVSVGYDRVLKEPEWDNLAERSRAAGAAVVWSFTSYNPDEVKSVQPGELYIDQRWAMGDAAVTVPGYDVRILPPSGVIGEAIFWSINAEILLPSKEQ